MSENFISKTVVAAFVLWAAVFALIAAAWIAMGVDPGMWRFAGLLAATACATSAGAATLHIKTYSLRTCNLIRATAGLDSCEPVRSLR